MVGDGKWDGFIYYVGCIYDVVGLDFCVGWDMDVDGVVDFGVSDGEFVFVFYVDFV